MHWLDPFHSCDRMPDGDNVPRKRNWWQMRKGDSHFAKAAPLKTLVQHEEYLQRIERDYPSPQYAWHDGLRVNLEFGVIKSDLRPNGKRGLFDWPST